MQEYEKKAKQAKNYRQALKKRSKACASTKKNDFNLEVNTAIQAIHGSVFIFWWTDEQMYFPI